MLIILYFWEVSVLMERKVLFLCTKNSARSKMAEAILNDKAGDKFIAYSCGSNPAKEINTYAVKAMEQIKLDIKDKKPESMEKYIEDDFDFVITLCDKMKEACPSFPGNPIVAHWGMQDPVDANGSEEDTMKMFAKTRNEIARRIELFISIPIDKLERLIIEKQVKEIGTLD